MVTQPLPFDEIKFEKKHLLEEILNTPDDRDIRYFVEVDLRYLDNTKEEKRSFHLLVKIKSFKKVKIMIFW